MASSEKCSAKTTLPLRFPSRSTLKEISRILPNRVGPLRGEKKGTPSRVSRNLKRGWYVGCTLNTKRQSRPSIPSISKCNSGGTFVSTPVHQPCAMEALQDMNSFVDSLFHLFNCSRASDDELMFLSLSRKF